MTNPQNQETDNPVRLKNAQKRIREAYFSHESGLFTLSCVPGAGKSTVSDRLAAEEVLRSYVAGDRTPEQHIAVVSFNRDEAVDIIPEICEQLRAIVKYGLSPVASEVSEVEVEFLVQRIQSAPFMGTVDGLLRSVLQDIIHDTGFEEMPSVGNKALIEQVHVECYERLANNTDYAEQLELLTSEYPPGEFVKDTADLLAAALTYCRDQQLSTTAFRQRLEQTHESVYPEKPESFDDIVKAVEQAVGDEDVSSRVRTEVDESDQNQLVAADRELYSRWRACIDAFCSLLSSYRQAYRELIREYGVLSHTDVAYLITSYFEGTLSERNCIDSIDKDRRQRVQQRYQSRLRSLIIDEAQDVSEIQHAALSHLTHSEMRVFACGDILQSIYLWRHANPTLFQSATTTGEYLGIDWSPHCNETATTTYRCVPDVAEAINEIAAPVFNDEARGNIGGLGTTFSALEAARDDTEETSVHIASFSSNRSPGTAEWANPDDGNGEADILATHLSKGLADGTFTDASDESLEITVLFRRRRLMSDYESAFKREGLRVRNASEYLFEDPAVRLVLKVCDWLIEPASPDRTRKLIAETDIGLSEVTSLFETHGWDIDTVLETAGQGLSETQQNVLKGLQRLRENRDTVEMRPAPTYLEEIIQKLALRTDSNKLFPGTASQQRIANLDALVDASTQWEGDEQYNPQDLVDLVTPFRENPRDGPLQPTTSTLNYDVEFRTIHQAKGDESDVVVVADPGFSAWSQGPHNQRFVMQGTIAGLAPPTETDIPRDIEMPPFAGGLYDPETKWERDIGLRWATARWCDTVAPTAEDTLVGPDRLQQAVKNERAEMWRLLYVALTRARDHIVLPLPRSLPGSCYRDRWIETLQEGLSFTGGTDSYTLSTRTNSIDIGVNDVDLLATRAHCSKGSDAESTSIPPHRTQLDPWVPRFIEPSTMFPLTESPDKYALNHLLEQPLHTTANEVPNDLPLSFECLGPEDVGSCLHQILTTLVKQGVSERELVSMGEIVSQVFDDVISGAAPQISNDEREGLWQFFKVVIDDFVDSRLWERIQRAESVSVEQSFDGLVKTSNIEVEIHGKADFVIELPSGERFVTDLKIALAEPTEETQRRHDLQVSTYAYLLQRQKDSKGTIRPTIETFGVVRKTVTASWPPRIIERRIDTLVD
jgi:ATP-dependent helicase/nuclease subunit A